MSVARSSLAMAGGSIASRVLGIVRQSLIVAIIGQGLVGNAFQTANTLPNIIYVVIAGGVLNSVLVPQLVKAMAAKDGGREYTDRLLTIAIGIFLVVTVVATLGAGWLVRAYAASLRGSALDLAVFFAVITIPQIFAYALYGLLGQVLQARGRFAVFGWSPALANVVSIAGLLGFAALYREQITSHAIEAPQSWTPEMVWWFAGTATLSIVAQALVLLVPLWRSGFRWRPRLGLRGVGLRATSKVTAWAFASLLVSQVAYLAASQVMWRASGSSVRLPGQPFVAGVAAYSNALLVFLVPHSLIALSLFTALYPRISAAVRDRKTELVRRDYVQGLTVPAALTVPSSVALVVFALPLMTLLFTSPDPAEVPAAALVLAALGLGVLPLGVDVLNQRILYAYEAGRSAFAAQLVLTLVALGVTGLALLVRPEWTAVTIALGLVVSNLVAAAYGMVQVRRRIGPYGGSTVVRTWVRMLFAASVAGLVASWPTAWLTDVSATWGRFGALLPLGVGGLLFAVVYVLLAVRMDVRELGDLLGPVADRVGRVLGPRLARRGAAGRGGGGAAGGGEGGGRHRAR